MTDLDAQAVAVDMQQRCQATLAELKQFEDYLNEHGHNAEIAHYKQQLQSEMKFIDKLAKDPSGPQTLVKLNSSNYSFYAALWTTAKTCPGVVALRKCFYWKPSTNGNVSSSGVGHKRKSNGALVDIVCQNGLEWVKVSTILEKRILWDLAKAGWVGSDSSDEVEQSDDDDEPEGLLKQAEALMKASKATRVKYRHPTVRLVLTRISSAPKVKEVGQILQKIRDMGVTVQTSDEIPESLPLAEVFERLAPGHGRALSDVLNLDCTVLLSFVSDLSHGQVDPQDWHNDFISKQRVVENKTPLLPTYLWPACRSRKLVCTKEAAVQMQEIVRIIGTEAEKRRTALLLGLDDDASLTSEQTLREFQTLSDHSIPSDWCLPVKIVDVDIAQLKSSLPPSAQNVSETLSELNQSVFFYGWASGYTTLSSNLAAAKEIENIIEENRSSDTESGPDIWPCMLRSLVGKEKQQRGVQKT